MNENENSYASNNQLYGSSNIKTEQKNPENREVAPLFKQLAVFLMGWFGIKVIATIVSLVAGNFVVLPNPDVDKVAYNNAVASAEAWLEFTIYLLTLISVLAILGKNWIVKLFSKYKHLDKVGRGVLYGVAVLAAQVIINLLIATIRGEQPSVNENETAVRNIVAAQPIVSFFFVVLFAPVCEELTYRFGLCGALARKNKIIGLVVSAVIFALIHTAFFSIDTWVSGGLDQETLINELINIPTYLACGLIFGFAYIKEDNIATNITAHMTNNLVAFISSATAGVVLNGVNIF